MNQLQRLAIACGFLGWMGVCGCSHGPQCIPVRGTVTRGGQPVAGAEVTFQPVQGSPAIGKTNEQGEFLLSTFGDKDGALPGDYRVTIVKNEPIPGPANDPYPRMKNLLPPVYANPQTTTLTAKVASPDSTTFDFHVD